MPARNKNIDMIRKQIALAHAMGPVYEDLTRTMPLGNYPTIRPKAFKAWKEKALWHCPNCGITLPSDGTVHCPTA
jgi:hypothetical protein